MTQTTTFNTKSTTVIGAVCDMVREAVETHYGFGVMSVIPLVDMNEPHTEVAEYRIEYMSSEGPAISVLKASEILYMLGAYVKSTRTQEVSA